MGKSKEHSKMTDEVRKRLWMGIAAAALLARVLVVFIYPYVSGDYTCFLRHWIEHLVNNGFEHGWPDGPWNYSMPYIYLLTGLARVTTHWLIGIKLISIFFDILMAWGAWRIVQAALPEVTKWRSWMAAAVILLLPTFFSNGAIWAQCDSIYVSFVLLSADALMRRKAVLSMILFGVAVAFKLQAVFVVPAMLMLTFKRRIPLWTWSLVILVYVVSAVPAMLVGRSVVTSINPHYSTAVNNQFSSLPWVPNVWHLMNECLIDKVILKGVIIACGIAALICAYFWSKKIDDKRLKGWGIPAAYFLSAAVVPFLLTGMHERYFAIAAAFGAILFIASPRRMWLCLMPEILSWPAYIFYLSGSNLLPEIPHAKVYYCGVSLVYLVFLVWLFRIYFAKGGKTQTKVIKR